ncbi:hypothetical protein [Roseobacter sp. TSBP12]|uniref:hypothetical protein n=1 Tax=Roseobacter sp. TSBP12 TaxID=1236613 RepID=UPI00125F947D|nr:hypothetical protein [Roseobacter sp. TSBP12]KAB6715851.1 hypothetical protein C8029_13015 [Roseobacter sp. TSBP12]
MKLALLPDPDFLDLAAWTKRLEELRAMSSDVAGLEASLDHARAMVDLLSAEADKFPAQAI